MIDWQILYQMLSSRAWIYKKDDSFPRPVVQVTIKSRKVGPQSFWNLKVTEGHVDGHCPSVKIGRRGPTGIIYLTLHWQRLDEITTNINLIAWMMDNASLAGRYGQFSYSNGNSVVSVRGALMAKNNKNG